ncbi:MULTISPECIES: winged helix-turn-helix domain-containing protein [Enterococcus]|uniref:Helix-turn-helix domain-containing protein n=1 Tax=Enterococcus alishanensis TaxID=1303817 RepID=A0ABS6TE29_9ENTE|nr:helix-turn-helix domain-containing protein [Enterococcus alishanensis]MBV7391186.1 helix-turn-helix domain-containing protein [Enterococcus alishanensis]
MKILILTKNVLAESSFQNKLQQLNHEVFCSTCLISDFHLMAKKTTQLVTCFDAVILSETISYQELDELMFNIRNQVPAIFRKYESKFAKNYEEERTEYSIDQWIKSDASLEEIRELCQTVLQTEIAEIDKGNYKKKYHFYSFGLSKKESLLLNCLYEYKGLYVSRQELIEKIWGKEEVTNSRLSALSTCVRNIKEKVEKSGLYCNPIDTSWGKGYKISDDFYQLIENKAG